MPITGTLIDANATYALENISESRRPLYESFLSKPLPYPDYLPFATSLFVDPDGLMWLERYRAPWDSTGTTTFEIVSPDFTRLGSFDTGVQFDEVYEIGPDHIVGRMTGDPGSRIVVYRLRRDD